ncbi:hypothetical protein QVD17_32889 [Tagetes erecta]|uniref:Uncharacterized protein n=1 Tax=Tagetes erecta TaxID=13708 RepID=A0AAD8K2L2_TARER|nr:hypothetical protein QVD17_32889 [Tagetes erecta]
MHLLLYTLAVFIMNRNGIIAVRWKYQVEPDNIYSPIYGGTTDATETIASSGQQLHHHHLQQTPSSYAAQNHNSHESGFAATKAEEEKEAKWSKWVLHIVILAPSKLKFNHEMLITFPPFHLHHQQCSWTHGDGDLKLAPPTYICMYGEKITLNFYLKFSITEQKKFLLKISLL